MGQSLERGPQALHLDQIRRPDPGLTRTTSSTNYWRRTLDVDARYLGITDTTVLYDAGQPEDLRYLLALLNSRLLTFRFRWLGKLKSGGVLEYFDGPVGMLPLRRVRPTAPEHKQLVKLAKDAEAATIAAAEATTPPARAAADDRVGQVLRRIDDIVYDLYGITTEERALVDAHLR